MHHHVNDEYKEITGLDKSAVNDAILDNADDNDTQAMMEWERSMSENSIYVEGQQVVTLNYL